jgi:hypothetical protein
MQYGPIPTNLLERIALWAGKVPIPMMDALFSIMKARGLMTAVSLGVFEGLRERPRTPADLAADLKLDAQSLELLMRSMVWAGYLQQEGNRFALSELSRRTMLAGAEMDQTGFVQWNYVQWRIVEQMENLLKTGKGVDFHKTMRDPQEWAWYQKGMLDVARFDAPVLAKSVPVKAGAQRLLDIAGSHGLLGAAICRRHPPMRSTVIDLPDAIPHAARLAESERITDVVEHRAADIMTSDLGGGYDVALLANIVHHFMPDPNIALLKRVHAALAAGGTVAIWELETPDPESKASEGDGAALFFRLTSTALCYSGKEYSRWLREAGFAKIRVVRPALSPGNVLVTGRKDVS